MHVNMPGTYNMLLKSGDTDLLFDIKIVAKTLLDLISIVIPLRVVSNLNLYVVVFVHSHGGDV